MKKGCWSKCTRKFCLILKMENIWPVKVYGPVKGSIRQCEGKYTALWRELYGHVHGSVLPSGWECTIPWRNVFTAMWMRVYGPVNGSMRLWEEEVYGPGRGSIWPCKGEYTAWKRAKAANETAEYHKRNKSSFLIHSFTDHNSSLRVVFALRRPYPPFTCH